jgi:HAD superfamily hydrolase (TIGR01509 family)
MKLDYLKAIALDLEGTVVNVEPAHHQGHIYSAGTVGVILTIEDCFSRLPHFIGGPDTEVAKEIAKLAGKDGDQTVISGIQKAKKDFYDRFVVTMDVQTRPGFAEFIDYVNRAGIPVTIGSLTNTDQARYLLEKSGLTQQIPQEMMVFREDVINGKPAPDVWIECARRMNVYANTMLVCEDSPKGIKGAAEVGAFCIGFPVYIRRPAIEALAVAGANRILGSWAEIRPDVFLQQIDEEMGQLKKQGYIFKS